MAGKSVVVGIDGSASAVRAAAFGWELAQAAHVNCRLVHAMADTWFSDYVAQPAMAARALLDEVAQHTRERMTESLAGAVPPPALAGVEVLVGRPAAILRAAAEEDDSPYVVVGGKHHTAIGRALIGSTAQDLVRTLDRPLFAVADREGSVRRILVGLDLSVASRPALAAARRLARLFDAELRVLHVVEPFRVPLTVPFALDEAEIAQRAESAFARLEGGAAGLPHGEWIVRRGTPVDIIAEQAADWAADVVVVGSHGKGWVDRVLIGSITERLLGALPTSVLVVPTGRRGGAARFPRKVGTRTKPRRARRKTSVPV